MDFMIAVVVIAVVGFVLYTVYTTPKSSGCVAVDARRAKEADAARAASSRRRVEPAAEKVAAPAATASPAPAPAAAAAAASAPVASRAAAAPAPSSAPAARRTPPARPAARTAASASAGAAEGMLRNPATGEKAALPANYRFAKKWIKDALVKEGLLDKVYKNNELDADASKKVKAALDQLKTLDKYKA